jgi:hemerythrin superfamily protein
LIAKAAGAMKAVGARLHGLHGVFKTLSEQHGEVGALLKRAVSDPGKRAELWPKIRQELVSHEEGELREVYPVLREYPETRALADRHEIEAGELGLLIDRLHETEISSADWGRFFEELVRTVEGHVEEEEKEIFPEAQRVIGAARAKELEPRFLAAKQKVAAML